MSGAQAARTGRGHRNRCRPPSARTNQAERRRAAISTKRDGIGPVTTLFVMQFLALLRNAGLTLAVISAVGADQ